MPTITVPTNITITYVVAPTTTPAMNRAAYKMVVSAVCQEIRRAVNSWLYN